MIWKSKDGTWNRGVYEFWEDYDDDDFDPEWNVTYGDNFNWVSTGHATAERADASWHGANPGGHTQIEYTPQSAAECDALDEKSRQFRAQNKR
ncbi:hypothetical protein IIE18_10430 [Pseudomonas sp. V1]|uniref:hypothetical protein n=1 Tax=Pseudomonas arcuscaelestis TaxID=2710591 RepID=UPI00193F7BEE|nr:hypothetical protein [Pseudomonas arcuscaelestis]MBM3105555.1 hypothetical protein [Pseudomonas arcuscaelestis]